MKRLLSVIFFFVAAGALCSAPDNSIQTLEKRLNLYPSNLKLRYVLSRAYAERGRQNPSYYDKSIRQLEEIIRVKQIAVVKFYLGLMYARKGDLDRAIYHWVTVVRSLKPNNLTTLRYLALAYEKKGKHSESLDFWSKLLSINPEDYKAHYHKALVTLKNLAIEESLRYSTAIRHFEKILTKYPKHSKTLYYLQATFRSSKQYLKQRQILNRLLELSPASEKIRKELALNKENLKRQPQDAVLSTPAPVAVKVVTEITDEDFQEAFNAEPEPQEVPVETMPAPVDSNPTLQPDSILSADAEILFNQGVTYLQNKEYDLALFNFLQAQELDPKFAQCYLQIGEVYLKLADTTPTEDKFKEHLRLASQSLTTAVELEPDSLLAHASKAKLKLVDQKEKEGFEVAHLKVAQEALRNGDNRFAIEEYIILITNNFISTELVFALRDLLKTVDGGLRLDLNNSIQPSISEGSINGLYLGARLRFEHEQQEGVLLADRIFDSKDSSQEFFRELQSRIDKSSEDFLDHYLLGRALLLKEAGGAAKKHLDISSSLASTDSLKKKVDFYLKKVKDVEGSKIFEQLAPLDTKRPPFESFIREKNELVALEPSFQEIFDTKGSVGLLGPKKELLERFLSDKQDHALAKFLLSLVQEQSSLESTLQQAENLKMKSLSSNSMDSGWHLQMGMLAVRLGDNNSAQRFFENSRSILLKLGWERYEPYSKILADEAVIQMGISNLELARELLRNGFLFNPYSRQVAHSQSSLYSLARGQSSFSADQDFFLLLMGQDFYSQIYRGEIGLILFWSIFIALIFFSSVIVFRKQEELKHFTDELFGARSVSIPLTVFLGGILLILFPTGLVIFLPILLWPFLDELEQLGFIVGLIVLISIPFFFPIGYVYHAKPLRAMHDLHEGQTENARKHYEERLRSNPVDIEARFQIGLLELLEGKGVVQAAKNFEQILKENPSHFQALTNLGVCSARRGDLNGAIQHFSKALKLNPIHDKVLYNLSRVYELKGDLKLASNYLKWIGGSGETSKALVERYLKLGSAAEPVFAPVFLENEVFKYDTLMAQGSSGGVFGDIIFFLAWFFLGGGGVALLLVMRAKMHIQITLCKSCEKRICANCQSLLSGDSLCSDCFESTHRRAQGVLHFRQIREASFLSKVKKISIFLPGFALVYQGRMLAGFVLALGFWSTLLLGLFQLDFIWNKIVPFQNSFTFTLQAVALGACLFLYLLGHGLSLVWSQNRFRD